MSAFIICYLAIYGGAHAYLMTRTVRAYHLAAPYPLLLTLFSLLMIAAPILVRVFERHAMEIPARVAANVGYFWMGFFFLFLSASIALDIARGAAALCGWIMQRDLWLPDSRLISVAASVALAASIYGMFEAKRIRIEQVTLETSKLPASAGRVRVVQLSDVHLGLMVGQERLRMILDKVAALKPDLLVSSGDLLDGQMDGLRSLDAELASLHAPLGKYAVLGNHEALAGLAPSEAFTERSGFRLLRQQSVSVNEHLLVAGVDDPSALRGKQSATDHSLLAPLPRDKYTILLKHRPKVEAEALGLFDLQLSGHVHKGQIFPFNLITHLVYPLQTGFSQLADGSSIYVSRGTGTWGPRMRVLAPPEITVIDLVPS